MSPSKRTGLRWPRGPQLVLFGGISSDFILWETFPCLKGRGKKWWWLRNDVIYLHPLMSKSCSQVSQSPLTFATRLGLPGQEPITIMRLRETHQASNSYTGTTRRIDDLFYFTMSQYHVTSRSQSIQNFHTRGLVCFEQPIFLRFLNQMASNKGNLFKIHTFIGI